MFFQECFLLKEHAIYLFIYFDLDKYSFMKIDKERREGMVNSFLKILKRHLIFLYLMSFFYKSIVGGKWLWKNKYFYKFLQLEALVKQKHFQDNKDKKTRVLRYFVRQEYPKPKRTMRCKSRTTRLNPLFHWFCSRDDKYFKSVQNFRLSDARCTMLLLDWQDVLV